MQVHNYSKYRLKGVARIPGQGPDERARFILRTLVEEFIRDGQPVGSRTLSKASGLSLSPATIRNVMADLEEYGFITSPHTSAGRVPTPKGYRFFVDTLIRLQQPGPREISTLQSQIDEELTGNAKSLAEVVSSALSALTSLASVVTVPRQHNATLRQIEFLAIGERRVLAILVSNNGEVQNRVIHVDRAYGDSELRRAANYLNDNFAGKDMATIRTGVLEELQRTQQSMNQLMIDTIAFAQAALPGDVQRAAYVMKGETKLMGFEELSDIEHLRQLFEAFSQQREILGLLDRSIEADGIQIFIGEESGYQLLDGCSVVTAPYKVNNEIIGVLGVIGPTRMAYERVIPIVDVTAKLVGAALNQGQH
jgi:heat-inducible transcriptional repressor